MSFQEMYRATKPIRPVVLILVLGICLVPWIDAAGVSIATSSANPMFATIVVNSTADTAADDGVCTLREAIIAANTDTVSGGAVGECAAGSGADTISFAGLAAGVQTITLTTELPPITAQVTIDGGTKSGFVVGGQPFVVLDCNAQDFGFNFSSTATSTSSFSIVRAVTINNATGGAGITGAGILIQPGAGGQAVANVEVRGCWIGLNATGTAAAANDDGIRILNSSNDPIGNAVVAGSRNVISGNDNGIFLGEDCIGALIEGNYIGLNPAGTAAIANTSNGIVVGDAVAAGNGSDMNTIGGTAAGAGNVISGQNGAGDTGILIQFGSTAIVQGNFIGLNAAGTAAVPNTTGIEILNASGNFIGSVGAGRNIISGNSDDGISLNSIPSPGNLVRGNYIGLGPDGDTDLGNGADGIFLGTGTGATACTIGPGNVISGNAGDGIQLDASANANQITGNIIGLNAAGTADRGNDQTGIQIGAATGGGVSAANNVIGGTTAAARNIISGNGAGGITLQAASNGNQILGNFIGTNLAGTLAIGNTGDGIAHLGGSVTTGTVIGSTTAGSGNVISGNTGDGIAIAQAGALNVTIKRNLIGLAAGATNAATSGIPNGGHGINISAAATGTTIGRSEGGASPSADGNLVAFNGGDGISFTTAAAATALISENSIFGNTGLGIDFDNNGVTPNDNPDAAAGPNSRTNFPVILSALQGSVTITGTLQSVANTSFHIEFFRSTTCDPTSFGEGQEFIGATDVTTNASGTASFSVTFAATPAVTDVITATATRSVATTIDVTSEFSQCRIVRNVNVASAVRFDGFEAKSYSKGVELTWRTGRESSNLGFNIYRDENGSRYRVNRSLITGSALMLGANASLEAGDSYKWWDTTPGGPGSVYWVEAIDLDGTSEWYGPLGASASTGREPDLLINHARTLDEINSIRSTTATVEPSHPFEPAADLPHSNEATISQQRTLASANAVKIGVERSGWYHVTRSQLETQGLPAYVNPGRLKLFVDGTEIPIRVTGDDDERFDSDDAVEFYGLALDTSSTGTRTYWLVETQGRGLRIPRLSEQGASPGPSSAWFTVEKKERTVYFSNLANGDQENYFGAVVRNSQTNQELMLRDLESGAGEDAELEIRLQGVTVQPHQVRISLNGSELTTVSFNGKDQGVAKLKIAHSLLREGSNTVTLEALMGSSDLSLVDRILVTYRHGLRAENNQLAINVPANVKLRISGFTRSDVRVFDVTDTSSVTELYSKATSDSGEFGVDVVTLGSGERRLLAVAGDAVLSPARLKQNVPSRLWSQGGKANLFIVTNAALIESLKPLVDLRRRQGYRVLIADVEDIYDEYSFGHKSPMAVRDWLEEMHSKSRGLSYVLLFGDGSNDPRNYLGFGDFDLVPSKSIDTAAAETVSDDWFADFDEDGIPEMAMGRLTVRNRDEAQAIIAKIIAYEQGEKGSGATLVSDSNDGFNFSGMTERVRALLPEGTKIDSITVGQTADAKTKLLESLNRGPRLVNYAGHGSTDLWRGNLLTGADAQALTNVGKPSLYLIMTCLNGYYQSPNADSLGESLLKSAGGAIAVWSSSGFTVPPDQEEMDAAVVTTLFSSNRVTIGQAVRLAKRQIADLDVRRTWILLGDPTTPFEH